MNSLTTGPTADVLTRLFHEAEAADRSLVEQFTRGSELSNEEVVQKVLDDETRDYKGIYRSFANNYLNVSPEFGKFLYMCARARKARRIVEFGTSFGVSAIHLACALRDGGVEGRGLIGTELEPSKAEHARANLAAAGLADLADIRVGDALETLKSGIDVEVDLVHLDGAFTLYLHVLKLLEPHLAPGAIVIGENAFEPAYLEYVRDPRNGYLSMPLPLTEGRGNEFSIFTRRAS